MKINLGEFAGSTAPVSKVLPLLKCADKKAKIAFKMKTTLIEEDCQDAETFSCMSGRESVESD